MRAFVLVAGVTILAFFPALTFSGQADVCRQSDPRMWVKESANYFGLPEMLLWAVLRQEGGKDGMANRNKGGRNCYDLGRMQINSCGPWMKKLKRKGIHEVLLVYDGCLNVWSGAWILASEIQQAGDLWRGVGNYHSRTPTFHRRYIKGVYRHWLDLARESKEE